MSSDPNNSGTILPEQAESDAVSTFVELVGVLDKDAVDLLEATKTEAIGSARRNAVRAAFAAIEGMLSAMKGVILEPFPGRRHYYSDAEVAMLREESYVLTDKGEAIAQVRFIRLEDNIRFVWKMFVREWGIDVDVDFPVKVGGRFATQSRSGIASPIPADRSISPLRMPS